jgi:hypothetical protein
MSVIDLVAYGHDNQGGIYTGTSFSDKTFYGFRLDSVGDLTCTIIRSDDDDVIELPSSAAAAYIDSSGEELGYTFKDPNEYRAHFWSMDAITFRFNQNNGHLEMVVY